MDNYTHVPTLIKEVLNKVSDKDGEPLEDMMKGESYLEIHLDNNEKMIIKTKDLDTNTIDFDKKESYLYKYITLADFVCSFPANEKSEVIIINDETGNEIFNGRIDYLQFDKRGCLDPLCQCNIESIEFGYGNIDIHISIYQEEEERYIKEFRI